MSEIPEVDADKIEEAARKSGLGRSTLYLAMNKDPAKRKGLPFLPYLKVGKARLILTESRRQWLRELEAAAIADADAA
jgi:hypothetical protein